MAVHLTWFQQAIKSKRQIMVKVDELWNKVQLKMNQNAAFDASRTAWPAVQSDNVFWCVLRLKDQEDLDAQQEIQDDDDDLEALPRVQFYLKCDGVIAFMQCRIRFPSLTIWPSKFFQRQATYGCGGQIIVDP